MNPDPTTLSVALGVLVLLGGIWAIGRGLRSDVREIVRDEVAPLKAQVETQAHEIEKLRGAKSDAFQRISRLEARA